MMTHCLALIPCPFSHREKGISFRGLPPPPHVFQERFIRFWYQGMASYWPTPAAIKADPIVADKMNTMNRGESEESADGAALLGGSGRLR